MVQDLDEKRLLVFDAILLEGENIRNKSMMERHQMIDKFYKIFKEENKKKRSVKLPFQLHFKNSWDIKYTQRFLLPDWQKKLMHKCNGVVFIANESVSVTS